MTNFDSINANQMWSLYLFNQDTPKKGMELLDESIIRDENTKGDTITLSAKEFMKDGAGRFVNGAGFNVINYFFSDDAKINQFIHDVAEANGKIDANGNMQFSLRDMLVIGEKIYDKQYDIFQLTGIETPNDGKAFFKHHLKIMLKVMLLFLKGFNCLKALVFKLA